MHKKLKLINIKSMYITQKYMETAKLYKLNKLCIGKSITFDMSKECFHADHFETYNIGYKINQIKRAYFVIMISCSANQWLSKGIDSIEQTNNLTKRDYS